MNEQMQLKTAVSTLENQRSILGNTAVDAAIAGLKQKLAELTTPSPKSTPIAERKFVTIMFADLSGFTALSETMDPEAVRDLMNRCFDTLVPVIHRYGGTVDKFIGDEIMALFGAPITHENDPERALRAALELMRVLKIFNQQQLTNLGMHIGINSGLVLAGGLGSSERQEYTVMGDVVNVAARLEGASERGQIFIGPDTHRLTAPLFEFKPLPPIQLKGKAKPLPIYQLLGLQSNPGETRGITGLQSHMVGRDAEIALFNQLIERLQEGKGAVTAVIGEAGLGKSRLVSEIYQTIPDNIHWVEGRALSYTMGMSYWLAQDILRHLIQVDEKVTPSALADQLLKKVTALMNEQTIDVYPYLARLLDIPLSGAMDERVHYLDPQTLQIKIQRAFIAFVRAMATDTPLVLVWEDLHWCDPSSFSIVENLASLVNDIPLLICLNFRPHKENLVWATHQKLMEELRDVYHIVEIKPLSAVDSASLVQNLLQVDNMPKKTLQLILDKAEGNPFFLEELLRSLMDAGIIILEGNRRIATSAIKDIAVPDTLQGVIAARIDQLQQIDKQTLQTASVVGRIFQKQVLRQLQGQKYTEHPLDNSLHQLQYRELIRPSSNNKIDLEYIFKHAVTQDVAYNSLLVARRKELHGVTAESIESLFPNNVDELAATLAYHYQHADQPEKAVQYLQQAAKRAMAIYANQEAITFYREALQQVTLLQKENSEQWQSLSLQLQESLGTVLMVVGSYDESREVFRTALAQLSTEQRIDRARLMRQIGDVWSTQREMEKSLLTYEDAIAILMPQPDSPNAIWWQTWLDIEFARAEAMYLATRGDELDVLLEEVRPIVDEHGTNSQKVQYYERMVMMLLNHSRWFMISDEIMVYLEKTATTDRTSIFKVFGEGFIHLWCEELEQAEIKLQELLKIAKSRGFTAYQLMAFTYLTVGYRMRGQIDLVLEYAEHSTVLAQMEKNNVYLGMAQGNLAWVAWQQGDKEAVWTHGTNGLTTLENTPTPLHYLVRFPLLALALEEGDVKTAVSHTKVIIHPKAKRLPDQLTEQLTQAVHFADDGNQDEACNYLKKAVQIAQQTGYF